MNNTLKKLLAPIASLRLTVVLLALAMVVILAGTTAQEHMGIWQVQAKFFHSWLCKIDLDLLAPLVRTHIPGAIPMLGGYSLIVLLLANLLSAHALRFKVSPWDIVLLPLLGFLLAILWAWQNHNSTWLLVLSCVVCAGFTAGVFGAHGKRGGVILIHLGLILLLVGELVTSLAAVESRMTIDEGSSANYSYDLREPELVLLDRSSPHQDTVYAVDADHLRPGTVVSDAKLPAGVQVKVERFYRNSELALAGTPGVSDAPAVTTDVIVSGKKVAAVPQAPFSGAGDQASQVDAPSAYVTLTRNGQPIGTYLASTIAPATKLEIDGKPFELALRFRRYYLPYRLELKDFRFDRYVGTNTPRNYSAHVRLVDPGRGEDREVTIAMNEPLRHAGLTFYQASFDDRTETTTHLQVVRNPGVLIPYVSCVIGGIGMIAHFGIVLVNFLRKRAKQTADAAVAASALGADGRGKARAKDAGRGGTYTLQPRRNWPAVVFSLAVGLVAVLYLVGKVTRSPGESKPFDLNAFGQIPISFGGRQQPLDSIARNHLKVISGREEFKDADGKKQPAIRWLIDMFTRQAGEHKVIRIDHSGIKSILAQHLPPPGPTEPPVTDRKLFSIMELSPALAELNRQVDLASKVPQRDRDLFQNKVIALSRQFQLAMEAGMVRNLFFVPPAEGGGEWRTVGAAFDASNGDMASVSPYVSSLFTMLNAYAQNDPAMFNAEVARYRTRVEQDVPQVVAKTDFETRYNVAAPFVVCMALYIGVFLLAVGSWLGWREPLRRGAFALLIVTLVFHTLALIGRMYISGRPPVTNLYSSAIFIAWGTALLAVLLEMVYRNGVGSVTAAVTAFPSLLIAHYLSFDGNGDTMQVLQAVLDTNFWLATHVVAITLGYAATFLAGFLGIVFIVLGIATPTLRDDATRKAIARMTYGILCFGVLFSFVGTVLGGIWADQSWGRFWGWDPKENGAVLIVLWNAVILHARWGGLVRERGLAVLSIFGNVVTAWSWFGTNMLGIGLHAYGFMDSAVTWLALFVFSQLAFILLGSLLPQRLWWSLRAAKTPRPGLAPNPA